MTKKVRFNDEVQINQMSINLSDHIKEVKFAKDIILNPNKSRTSVDGRPSDTEPLIPANDKILGIPINFWIWILVGIVLIVILAIFYATDIGKRVLFSKKDA